jgi:5-(carboxyamino)imidazole ribonucleotide mutase
MVETGTILVGLLSGSDAEREMLRHAEEILNRFSIAFRTEMLTQANVEESVRRMEKDGAQVIIATFAGGNHLPAQIAKLSNRVVLGVPLETGTVKGLDLVKAAADLPAGVPVALLAIGKAGIVNAALWAVAVLANTRPELREALARFRREQAEKVLAEKL